MMPAFRGKGLSLELRRNSDVTVVTDADKLDTIVRNLLSNALKFTDKGGAVIDYGLKDDSFFIAVSDSGRGIPESDLPRIFTRFYRVEGADTEGLGLGLAIVNELVNVRGGRIDVTSKVGEGSTFRFSIPQSPASK